MSPVNDALSVKMSMSHLPVREIMTKNVITIHPDRSVMEAVRKMIKRDVECLPVTESKTLVGLITFRDIVVKVVYRGRNPRKTKVRDIMSKRVLTCSPESEILEIVKVMRSKKVRRIPVIDGHRKLVGIVTDFDLALFGWKP